MVNRGDSRISFAHLQLWPLIAADWTPHAINMYNFIYHSSLVDYTRG